MATRLDPDHEKIVREVNYAGEGWRTVAIIMAIVLGLAGAVAGYLVSRECFPGFGGGLDCAAGDLVLVYVGVGALGGLVPALPILAVAQLYGHIAKLERTRGPRG